MNNKKTYYKLILIIIFFFWVILSVNPYQDHMTKGYILEKIDKKYTLSLKRIRSLKDLNKIKRYPIVLKPDICNGNNKGVSLVKSRKDQVEHLKPHN